MKIIIGLGNPGLRYKHTRHNAGFLALNVLSKKYALGIKKRGFGGVYGFGRIKGYEVMLFEPLTRMNLSGEAVKAVCSSKLEDKKDLLVISDDFNLPLGSIRLREKGSSGGHNGLESIIEQIGPDFTRLRIGIGSGFEGADASSYVLGRFSRKEKPALNESFTKAVRCIELWLDLGVKDAIARHDR